MPSDARSRPRTPGRGKTEVGISTVLQSMLRPGLSELLKGYEYAQTPACSLWDVAVEIGRLHCLGMTECDLRWLVRMGYVEHARETTRMDDDGREFRPTGNLSFSKRTCFVLTESGVAFAATQLRNGSDAQTGGSVPARAVNGRSPARSRPHWDAHRRKLAIAGQLVRQYKWPADNQETILAAFQEEGWPPRIDDPLVPVGEQDSKRRLNDTIKCLNRSQKNRLIHFRGDGTGQGIVWEHVDH